MSLDGVSVLWEARKVGSEGTQSESTLVVVGELSARQPENVLKVGVPG